MEVHAHTHLASGETHTPGKKWTHHFWEFFMLFLAVTLGFFVENQREHYVEHKREKQYMRSMMKDLYTDLENIELTKTEKERMVQFGDSITQLYINGDYHNHTGNFYYYARNFSTYQNLFFMTDGTLIQLKNSGGLRLIRKLSVVDSLQAYDNLYNQFRLSQERESAFLADYREIMSKLFDIKVFNGMIKTYPDISMPEGNPPLFNADKQLINELLMKIHIAKRNKLGSIHYLNRLKEKANNLIAMIKKEYQLE
jgi:hypothetical protein